MRFSVGLGTKVEYIKLRTSVGRSSGTFNKIERLRDAFIGKWIPTAFVFE